MSKKAVAAITESEEELVSRSRSPSASATGSSAKCADKWTEKYARGRTDADFANLLGLSPDQVFQRRRIWETFADVHAGYASLKWSHFYAALTWDDAPECLQWADENQATVAEMKAWRRSLHGEDLTVEAASDEWGVTYVPSEAVAVKDPGEGDAGGARGRRRRTENGSDRTAAETVAGFARDSAGGGKGGDSDYAPFRSGAGSPPPKETSSPSAPRPTRSRRATHLPECRERWSASTRRSRPTC